MDRLGLEGQNEGRLGLRREKKKKVIEMVNGSLARKKKMGEV